MASATSKSAISIPDQGDLIREEQGVSVYIDQANIGTGSLYIAQSCIVWHSDAEDEAFRLHYPDISLHGISRDNASFQHSCLYLMIDASKNDIGSVLFKAKLPSLDAMDVAENGNVDDDDDDDDDDESKITELRFVPCCAESLDALDEAISDGNALHPDEDDSNSEADDEQFEDADEDDVGGGDNAMN